MTGNPALTIVRAWSGPRNISTALMRAWENRPDTEVLDEPLYAHYLESTGWDHPGRAEVLRAGPVALDAAVRRCVKPPVQVDTSISYQKHMAHHLLPGMELEWVGDAANVLVIRHPRRVIASYIRVRPSPELSELGLRQQMALMERFGPLPVIDADRFLAEPERHLRLWCDRVGVDLEPSMLSWPPGPRPSDGVWAPFWYGAVERSTTFGAPPPGDPAGISLPDPLEPLAADALAIYEQLLASAW